MNEKTAALAAGGTLRRLADRPDAADYAALSTVFTLCHPDHPQTADEFREQDQRREARHFLARFLAEQDGEPVGMGRIGQLPWGNDPRTFRLAIHVVPQRRRQGIGAALYDSLHQAIAPLEPVKVSTSVREDEADAVRFAHQRGFEEQMRKWESRLDVTAFDAAPFQSRREEPTKHGIRVAHLAELQAETPDWAMRLYELEKETSEDVPRTDPFTFPDFDAYQQMVLHSPNFLPDADAVAVDTATGEWVGASGLWKRQANNWLDTGGTGVKRSHRRQGIAFALKLKVIDYAKGVGCPIITTENATTNRGMLSINEALGYQKQPASILMAWQVEGQGGR